MFPWQERKGGCRWWSSWGSCCAQPSRAQSFQQCQCKQKQVLQDSQSVLTRSYTTISRYHQSKTWEHVGPASQQLTQDQNGTVPLRLQTILDVRVMVFRAPLLKMLLNQSWTELHWENMRVQLLGWFNSWNPRTHKTTSLSIFDYQGKAFSYMKHNFPTTPRKSNK